MSKKILEGTVHELPQDIKKEITLNPQILELWQNLTPLGRNEYICWITSAKKEETRKKRIDWMQTDLLKGKKRPCCWPGCPHR